MFTGIITARGKVVSVEPVGTARRLVIESDGELSDAAIGASIACDGICLTATAIDGKRFAADASEETLKLTTLGDWRPGRRIHLERALRFGDEMGGHLVSGHVDGLAVLLERREREGSVEFRLQAPEELARFIAKKGSVALDGVSLTVTEAEGESFGVALIPHTLAVTGWGDARPGQTMNLEIDLLARYVARLGEAACRI